MNTDDAAPTPGRKAAGDAFCTGPCHTGEAAQSLARIEAALARMDTGRYGFCVTCEGQIGLGRLEADPAEAMCEDCAETVPA